jgi:hypothetical protein
MLLRSWILFVAAALALPACAEKAGADLAKKACVHTVELGFRQGLAKSHRQLSDAEQQKLIAQFVAEHAAQIERCTSSGAATAKSKVECTLHAASVDEAVACAK